MARIRAAVRTIDNTAVILHVAEMCLVSSVTALIYILVQVLH